MHPLSGISPLAIANNDRLTIDSQEKIQGFPLLRAFPLSGMLVNVGGTEVDTCHAGFLKQSGIIPSSPVGALGPRLSGGLGIDR